MICSAATSSIASRRPSSSLAWLVRVRPRLNCLSSREVDSVMKPQDRNNRSQPQSRQIRAQPQRWQRHSKDRLFHNWTKKHQAIVATSVVPVLVAIISLVATVSATLLGGANSGAKDAKT